VIFCVAREDDPVIPLVRSLMRDYSDVAASLLIGESRISSNPKLNNMAKGWMAARYDTVVFADSNLLLTSGYCAQVCACFAPGVMIVSSPPVGSAPDGFWGEMECAMLNTHAARWQYAAAEIDLCFAQGKTLAFRKSLSPANLMVLLGEEPAEDAAATKLAKSRGEKIALVAPAYSHPVGPRSLRSVWKRHSRWAKLRRATFPLMFSAEILTGILPVLAALVHVAWTLDIASANFFLPALLLWYLPEAWLAWRLGWTLGPLSPFAWLVRDCLMPLIYATAWLSDEFVWNGHRMSGAKPPREAF
jgi:ceramide glucosyltransferase